MISRNLSSGSTQHGFSLLELTIVVGIIAALFAVALDRFLALKAEAERVGILQVEGSLQSALGIELSSRIARNQLASAGILAGSNPMDLLAQTPPNYIGALDHPAPASVEAGKWYFDTTRRVLVYRVKDTTDFHDGLGAPARIEYRIELVYRDNNQNGHYDADTDSFYGVKLVTLSPYHWNNPAPETDWFLRW